MPTIWDIDSRVRNKIKHSVNINSESNILLTTEAKITKQNWPDSKVNHLIHQEVRGLSPGLQALKLLLSHIVPFLFLYVSGLSLGWKGENYVIYKYVFRIQEYTEEERLHSYLSENTHFLGVSANFTYKILLDRIGLYSHLRALLL